MSTVENAKKPRPSRPSPYADVRCVACARPGADQEVFKKGCAECKRAKNTAAAATCRKKKVDEVLELRHVIKENNAEIHQLRGENSALKARIAHYDQSLQLCWHYNQWTIPPPPNYGDSAQRIGAATVEHVPPGHERVQRDVSMSLQDALLHPNDQLSPYNHHVVSSPDACSNSPTSIQSAQGNVGFLPNQLPLL